MADEAADFAEAHARLYLESDGAEGHLIDATVAGGLPQTPCLLLKTKGRRSGEWKIAPLIYGRDGDKVVLVASKAGGPNHPAWYLNLIADPEVRFQVGRKKHRGKARVAEGAERQRLWDMMARDYPPYIEYQTKTDRVIPVVVLESAAEIDSL